jgi:hypothetical protein
VRQLDPYVCMMHMHVFMSICMHVFMSICMHDAYACMYVVRELDQCVCMYECMYASMYVRMSYTMHMHVCMLCANSISVYICMYVMLYACTYELHECSLVWFGLV